MRNHAFLFAAAISLLLSGCNSFKTEEAPFDHAQLMKPLHFRKALDLNVGYLLFLPSDYSRKSATGWPLIFFLHGAGERGENVRTVAIHGPPQYIAAHPDFPFIIVAPQCRKGEHWSNEILTALLNEVVRKYKVDEKRIYLTGLSMGGYGTWDLGLTYPERFAAIAPVCGGGQMISLSLASREKPQALKGLGVWAFHGVKDPVVPIDESQRMIDALKKVGVKDVKFTTYPEAGHNSWTKTYDNPELYQWFLQHQRREPSKEKSK